MAQNINNVAYALIPAGGAQQPPPVGQTYHLPANTLVGEYSHRRTDYRKISDHKISMGIPPHAKGHPPALYLIWREAVKDQMLARGFISDNGHFPDAEFLQIVTGMRRLKPACDKLATSSAANNMPSMQEIDEAVLQLVKDCGKKLAHTITTNNNVPPPVPGVPPAQVIINPVLLPLNAPPQCQWSIATAVPNAGPVVQNAPQANPQNNPPPAGPANPQGQNNPPVPAYVPAQIQHALPMFIPGTPVHVQGALAIPQGQNNPPPPPNPQGPINPPFLAKVAAQIQPAHPMFIPGTPVRVQGAPPANIPRAAAPIAQDPGFQYLGVARRVPRPASDLSQTSEFFPNIPTRFFFFTY